jgi:NADH-quinone oxidoreductase subunit L
MQTILWLILAAPLLSFLVIAFGTMRARDARISGYVSIAAMLGSTALAFAALAGTTSETHLRSSFDWFWLGPTRFTLGVLLDPLTAVMLIVVTVVSLLVQIYSQGYMSGDPGYRRYFAFMSLFTMSMLGLVLADNFLQLYIFWELVGLCSYLLIGFWYQRPEAAAAAKKAFIVTRVGDLGFLVGILVLFAWTGTFEFDAIESAVKSGVVAGGVATVAAVLLFSGAVGKSAQFPLHVWLPDAMEGPTPVSALIHAATMVAAGVYLVARAFGIFSASPEAMLVVAGIGGFTALFAATHALVGTDIKRVLAYSTVSQLGYMMMGLGLGAYVAGVFHLFNHAFFKALLFLAAGVVIHLTGVQDLPKMGGLAKKMPITALTFLLAGLSLAGLFPLSGFWSKEQALIAALVSGQTLLFAVGLVTVALTAFYIGRAWLLAFWGESRAVTGDSTGSHRYAGRSGGEPAVMTVPLLILAVPAVLSGFLGSSLFGDPFGQFLGHAPAGTHEAGLSLALALASTVVVLAGIGLAWLMYGSHVISAERVGAALRPVYVLLERKYWIDDFYGWLVRVFALAFGRLLLWFDTTVIDGIVNGVAWLASAVLGQAASRSQTGVMPNYGLVFFAGLLFVSLAVLASYATR